MVYGITYSASSWCAQSVGSAPAIAITRTNGSEIRIQQYTAVYTVAAGTSPIEQIITQTVE